MIVVLRYLRTNQLKEEVNHSGSVPLKAQSWEQCQKLLYKEKNINFDLYLPYDTKSRDRLALGNVNHSLEYLQCISISILETLRRFA